MILECENLSKNYGSVKALDNLTLKIESGKIVGLLGPNGHGKTTLIKTLSGLLSKDKGKVLIDGKRIGIGAFTLTEPAAPAGAAAFGAALGAAFGAAAFGAEAAEPAAPSSTVTS